MVRGAFRLRGGVRDVERRKLRGLTLDFGRQSVDGRLCGGLCGGDLSRDAGLSGGGGGGVRLIRIEKLLRLGRVRGEGRMKAGEIDCHKLNFLDDAAGRGLD